MSQPNAASTAVNVFTAPREAFAAIKDRPRVLLPLVLVLAGAAATTFVYMNGVDIEWFFERAALANPQLTEQQAEQSAAMMAALPQAGIASVIALVAAVSTAVFLLLQALYLRIVGLFIKDGVAYKHWFGLVVWASLPTLLTYLATIVNLTTNDITLLPQERTNPLSFWSLLDLEPLGAGTFDQIVMNMGPITLWTAALLVVGHRLFTSQSLVNSAVIVLLPIAVVAGLAFAL